MLRCSDVLQTFDGVLYKRFFFQPNQLQTLRSPVKITNTFRFDQLLSVIGLLKKIRLIIRTLYSNINGLLKLHELNFEIGSNLTNHSRAKLS